MARNDESGNMVLSPRCVRLGAGQGGEMMKLIGAFFLLIVFISPIYAQDLFDQAEIEFDVDYIDIDKIKLLGSKNKGQVIAVWMKSGSVLTKTLSNSKIKYSVADDNRDDVSYAEPNHEVYNIHDNQNAPLPELDGKSVDEIIAMAYEIINKPEWTYNYRWSESYSEELDLNYIMGRFDMNDRKGPELVKLGMDIITADLSHGQKVKKLYLESSRLKEFAKGDDQLTQTVNDFLKENGFNEEEK